MVQKAVQLTGNWGSSLKSCLMSSLLPFYWSIFSFNIKGFMKYSVANRINTKCLCSISINEKLFIMPWSNSFMLVALMKLYLDFSNSLRLKQILSKKLVSFKRLFLSILVSFWSNLSYFSNSLKPKGYSWLQIVESG